MKRQVLGLSLTLAVSLGMLPPMQTAARAEEISVVEEASTAEESAGYTEAGETNIADSTTEQLQEIDVGEAPSDPAVTTLSPDDIQVLDNTDEFSATAPQLTGISGTGTNITLQWSALDGAEQYVIYRRNTPDAAWEKLGQVASTETRYKDSTAKGSESYYYSIRAKKKAEDKTVWSKRSESFLRVGRPTLKSAEEISGAIKVRWYKVEGAESYRIFRHTESDNNWQYVGDAKVNGYQDKTAKPNMTYYYTVRAVCTNSGTEFVSGQNKTGVSAKRVLSAPKITSLSGLKTKVTLQWSRVKAAQSYQIERMEFGGAWQKLGTTTELSYRDTGLSADNTYYYRVRAAKKAGDTTIYGDAQEPAIQRPGATKLIDVTASGSGLRVRWEAVDGVKDYRVYRRGLQDEKWSCIGTVSDTTYQDNQATAGKYWYTVRAVSQNPTTFYGAFDKNGVAGLKQLATPELVKISNVSTGIRVEWGKVNYATGYIVYRRENADDKWKKLKTISSGDKVTCIDKTAAEEKTYHYTVRATYDGENASGRSSTGLVMQRIRTPAMKEVGKHKEGLKVSWTPVSYADGYYIYRRSSTSEQWEKIADVSAGSTSYYVDSKVSNGTWYNYTVRAFCGDYYSGITAEGKSYAYLKPVSITSIKHSKSQTVTVEWTENPEAERYVISYATQSDFSNAQTANSTTTSATLTGLTKGEVYYIRVNARKEIGGVKYFSRFSDKRAVAIDR